MRRYLTRSAAMLVAASATLVLAGCVNLPTSGQAQHADSQPSTEGLSQQIGVELDPIPPGAQFMPAQIVRGFLAASGADKHIARKYLTPRFAPLWQPSSLADVVDSSPEVAAFPSSSHVTGGHQTDQVVLSTNHLATLVSAVDGEPGQLSVARGGPFTFIFQLTLNSHSQWRINAILDQHHQPDKTLLLLTEDDFQRDYLPRDLYFPADSSASTLVPSPVYISATAGQLGVQQLVNGLTVAPPGKLNWLWRAVTTAFPQGTHLSAEVRGSLAVVTLQGARGTIPEFRMQQMEAQLLWTLTQSPYSAVTGIGSVEFRVGHQATPPLVLHSFRSWGPPGVLGPLYYQTLNQFGAPALGQISGVGASHASKNSSRSTEQLPAGVGPGPLTAIAVSPSVPGSTFFTTSFAGCRGRNIYIAPLQPFLVGGDLLKTSLPVACTSLSWDDKGKLWVTAGNQIFVVTETPSGPHVVLAVITWTQDTIESVKVAPDGVRVAMIVKGKNGSSVRVAAISKRLSKKVSSTYLGQAGQILEVGPDVVDPTALAWWNSDRLLVIGQSHGQPHLYEVPLDGGASAAVPTPPGTTSVAANGVIAVVGTTGQGSEDPGHVLYSRELDGIWRPVGNGKSVTYPG